jgi:hypothetical protein
LLAYTGRIKDWKFNQKLVPKGLRILPLRYSEKKECKYTGYWKVYSDERKARNIFERYKRCYTVYYYQWSRGKTVEELTRNMA